MDLCHKEGTNVVPEGDLLLVQLLPPPLLWGGFPSGLPCQGTWTLLSCGYSWCSLGSLSQESIKDGDISFPDLRGGPKKVGGKSPVGSETKLRDREEIEGMVACMGPAFCEELVL